MIIRSNSATSTQMAASTPADWVIFRTNQQTNLTSLSKAQAYRLGDLDGDLHDDFADFVLFKNAYDIANGAGAFDRWWPVFPSHRPTFGHGRRNSVPFGMPVGTETLVNSIRLDNQSTSSSKKQARLRGVPSMKVTNWCKKLNREPGGRRSTGSRHQLRSSIFRWGIRALKVMWSRRAQVMPTP